MPWARATGPHTSLVRIGRNEVQITNPEKVFFPEAGLTKDDLVAYYLEVAPCALHHIRRRLFHMKRYPNGVEGDFFHQKRVPPHPEFVGEQYVEFPSGHSTVFAVIDNAAALAWVANLGCIELHTWHSRVEDIERPDYLLIDLDPTTDGQWPYVREIALVVRDVMEELGIAAYPKTSPRRRGESPIAAACSSTSARTRATGRSRPRTPSARLPTRASPRRSAGTRSRLSSLPASPSRRCVIASRTWGISRRTRGDARSPWCRASRSSASTSPFRSPAD